MNSHSRYWKRGSQTGRIMNHEHFWPSKRMIDTIYWHNVEVWFSSYVGLVETQTETLNNVNSTANKTHGVPGTLYDMHDDCRNISGETQKASCRNGQFPNQAKGAWLCKRQHMEESLCIQYLFCTWTAVNCVILIFWNNIGCSLCMDDIIHKISVQIFNNATVTESAYIWL